MKLKKAARKIFEYVTKVQGNLYNKKIEQDDMIIIEAMDE